MMKEFSAEILSNVAAEKSWTAVFSDLVKARLTTLDRDPATLDQAVDRDQAKPVGLLALDPWGSSSSP